MRCRGSPAKGGSEAKCSAGLDLPKEGRQGEYDQDIYRHWTVFCFLRRPV